MTSLTLAIVVVFIMGYLCIALESLTKVNKAPVALLMCVGGPAPRYTCCLVVRI